MTRKIEQEEAKQGRWGVPVLVVLGVALLLALIGWAGLEAFFS